MSEKFFKSNPDDSEGLDHRGFDESPKEVFERYLRLLNLDEAELLHKHILDVGAGSAGFAKYIQDANLETHIVSVDRNYHEDEKPISESYAVAQAQHLPFADETFDLVVSTYALPHVGSEIGIRDKAERIRSRDNAIRECVRVLKKGGEIRFGGIPKKYPQQFEGWREGLAGFVITVEDLIETKGLLVIKKNS